MAGDLTATERRMESSDEGPKRTLGIRLSPRPEASWPTRRQLWQAIGLSAGLTLAARVLVPLVGGFGGDPRHYIALASNPDAVVPSPFAYRVLTPWLVQMIGTPPVETYHALSLIFLAAAGVFVYLITRGIGGGHLPALLATFGLLTVRGWLFSIWNPYLADPAAMSLTGAAFAALVWGADLLLPLVLVAWALSREIWAGFMLPAYAWVRQRFVDRVAIVRVAIICLPAVIMMLILFRLAPASGASGFSRIADYVVQGVFDARLGALRFWTVYTFAGSLGIWWLLALARPRPGRALWWWMVPVFGQFVLGADWSRFAMYAFVVVVPVGAMAVWSHPRRSLLLVLVVLQLLPTAVDIVADGLLRLNRLQPSLWVTMALMAATLVVLAQPYLGPLLRRSTDSLQAARRARP
jgi:hypothetical protein